MGDLMRWWIPVIIALILIPCIAGATVTTIVETTFNSQVNTIDMSTIANYTLAGTNDGNVTCYNTTGVRLWSIKLRKGDPVRKVVINPDGYNFTAMTWGGYVLFGNVKTGATIAEFDGSNFTFETFQRQSATLGGYNNVTDIDMTDDGLKWMIVLNNTFVIKGSNNETLAIRTVDRNADGGPLSPVGMEYGAIDPDGGFAIISSYAGSVLSAYKLVDNSSSWYQNYTYRRQFTVTGSSDGTLNYYPINITVYNTTGTPSGSSVYVGQNTTLLNWNDVRFVDGSTGLPVQQMMWQRMTDYANFTLTYPLLAQSEAKNVYMYYGNSSAEHVHNATSIDFVTDTWTGVEWQDMNGTYAVANVTGPFFNYDLEPKGGTWENLSVLFVWESPTISAHQEFSYTTTAGEFKNGTSAGKVRIWGITGYYKDYATHNATATIKFNSARNGSAYKLNLIGSYMFVCSGTTIPGYPDTENRSYVKTEGFTTNYEKNHNDYKRSNSWFYNQTLAQALAGEEGKIIFQAGWFEDFTHMTDDVDYYTILDNLRVNVTLSNKPTVGSWSAVYMKKDAIPAAVTSVTGTITSMDISWSSPYLAVGTSSTITRTQPSATGFSGTTSASDAGDKPRVAIVDGGVYIIVASSSTTNIYTSALTLDGTYDASNMNDVDIASSNGLWGLSGDDSGKVYVFSKEGTSGWELVYDSAASSTVESVAISSDGLYGAAGRADGSFIMYYFSGVTPTTDDFIQDVYIIKDGLPYIGATVYVDESTVVPYVWTRIYTKTVDSSGMFNFEATAGNYYRFNITDELDTVRAASSSHTAMRLYITSTTVPYIYQINVTDGGYGNNSRLYLNFTSLSGPTTFINVTVTDMNSDQMVNSTANWTGYTSLTGPTGGVIYTFQSNHTYLVKATILYPSGFRGEYVTVLVSKQISSDSGMPMIATYLDDYLDTQIMTALFTILLMIFAGLASYANAPKVAVGVVVFAAILSLTNVIAVPITIIMVAGGVAMLSAIARSVRS